MSAALLGALAWSTAGAGAGTLNLHTSTPTVKVTPPKVQVNPPPLPPKAITSAGPQGKSGATSSVVKGGNSGSSDGPVQGSQWLNDNTPKAITFAGPQPGKSGATSSIVKGGNSGSGGSGVAEGSQWLQDNNILDFAHGAGSYHNSPAQSASGATSPVVSNYSLNTTGASGATVQFGDGSHGGVSPGGRTLTKSYRGR
jgi:hypothetical protein